MIKQHGKDTPKTIIFCDTLYSIASVTNYMPMTLGEAAFYLRTSRKHEHCLLGIFHFLSPGGMSAMMAMVFESFFPSAALCQNLTSTFAARFL